MFQKIKNFNLLLGILSLVLCALLFFTLLFACPNSVSGPKSVEPKEISLTPTKGEDGTLVVTIPTHSNKPSSKVTESLIEPQGSLSPDPNDSTKFVISPDVADGTLVTITNTLSDGSIIVYNVVKGDVVCANSITLDDTQDFTVIPGQSVDIPINFEPKTIIILIWSHI